jgi:CDP-diacylglycerol--serine O-phosphatidyltransferase
MRTRRRKKLRQKERKGIYILPNLFTSAGLFGGFYAIIASIQGRYEAAAAAIILAAICDGLDGRVARLTHTTSQFGVEFDSLSDLVAFGVAPGILAFEWAMQPFGRFGWLAAFLFVICGALRLARFNVQKNIQDPRYFRGLPIPAAACFIASMILFIEDLQGVPEDTALLILVMAYVLSFLMVSAIPFSSFKSFDIRNQKPFHVLVSLILMCTVIAYKPKIMLFLIMAAYVLSGPVMGLRRLYTRRHAVGPAEQNAPLLSDQATDPDALESKGVYPGSTA